MSDETTKPLGTILIADDEDGMRGALSDVLRRQGWTIDAVDCGEAALERLKAGGVEYTLLMTDYRMGGMTGLELVREANALRPALPVIMMTAYGTVEDAVTAMKQGADDYLLKPFSFQTVLQVIDQTLERRRKAAAISAERADKDIGEADCEAVVAGGSSGAAEAARGRATNGGGRTIIGADPAWTHVARIAREVADSPATVLLTGESGTGKEVLARYVHETSGRRGPFVAINCAALPEGVLESELFGHEKGAFTGATLSRKGRFELADGGTILLDEVSEMPLALQAKLLRVLQEREVSPIGGADSIKLDIRVIATTNRDLERYVEEGHFRRDLFYRLNVISIHLPALRHRRRDIVPLAEHFLARFARPDRPRRGFTEAARDFLEGHAWPGNVRELENLVERATLLSRGELIDVADFHLGGRFTVGLDDESEADLAPGDGRREPIELVGQTLEALERRLIMQTLEHNGGNRTRTAEMLGVSVRTIRNKLHQYGHAEESAAVG